MKRKIYFDIKMIAVLVSCVILLSSCQKILSNYDPISDSIDDLSVSPEFIISSESISLLPVADAYVQDGKNANINYGQNPYLVAKSDAVDFSREIYLLYDLSSLPSDISDIQLSRIELTGGVANEIDTANAVWEYYATSSTNWQEKSINWNNAPKDGSKLGEVNGKLKIKNGVVSFDISAATLESALKSDKKLSIRIVSKNRLEGAVPSYSDFLSKEALEVESRPKLRIAYTSSIKLGYYSNLVMDQITYDSIQSELKSNIQAQEFIKKQVTDKANQALLDTINAVVKDVSTDGNIVTGGAANRIYSLGLQYFLFQKNPDAQKYANKAKSILLKWAEINVPTDHTPNESGFLPFLSGYSLIRAHIDVESRVKIDNWLRDRYNYYSTLSVRTNNWETIRNLLMLNIAYILNDESLINKAVGDFNVHHNKNYRADGASVDFLGRDGFAYHVYDMLFVVQIARTLYINKGRDILNDLVNHRSAKWVNLRINANDKPVLGGSMRDAVSFMAPYVFDPQNNVHLEFVNTEWAPDKTRGDYNKPYNPRGSIYVFVEAVSIFKNEMTAFIKKLDPNFTRYSDLKYYLNSFGPTLKNATDHKVTLYGDMPFRGWYKELEVGSYQLNQLKTLGVIDNALSSISIPKGYKVILYDNDDLTGESVLLTSHTLDLGKFDNKTSSLKIEKNN